MSEAQRAQKLGIIAALNKPQARELEAEIAPWLAAQGVHCRDEATMLREGFADLDAIVVLGGVVVAGRIISHLPTCDAVEPFGQAA